MTICRTHVLLVLGLCASVLGLCAIIQSPSHQHFAPCMSFVRKNVWRYVRNVYYIALCAEHELQFGQFVESVIALCAEHGLRYAQNMNCSLNMDAQNMNCSYSAMRRTECLVYSAMRRT